MRFSLFAAGLTLVAACAGAAKAQTTHQSGDGTSAYIMPAGVEVLSDPALRPDQAGFSIMRTTGGRKERAGACVLGISTLAGQPNLQTWAAMVTAHRTDTETKARAKASPPTAFVSLGGYRDLTLVNGGDGYFFWFDQNRSDGLQETRLIAVALLRPQSLFAGNCTSAKGKTFTPAEIEVILNLVSSVRRS